VHDEVNFTERRLAAVIYLNKNILKIVFFFLLFAILAISSLSEDVEKTEQILAIKNAHIYPVTNKEIPSGVLLVKGKKIVAVGADVSIPAGAWVIDAQGKHIIPGIVESHSHMGQKQLWKGPVTGETPRRNCRRDVSCSRRDEIRYSGD